jgi:phosphoribosyl 1,2-cyclic phosphodiesterase
MNLKKTRLHILHSAEKLSPKAKSGVSLHCHTEHSREMLDFVPHYAAKIPIINFFWQRERKKYQEREGKEINFSTGFWSPPLTAQEVYNLEKNQRNRIRRLGFDFRPRQHRR